MQKQYKEKWNEENTRNLKLYEVDGNDMFSRKLREVAPGGNVTVKNLQVSAFLLRIYKTLLTVSWCPVSGL